MKADLHVHSDISDGSFETVDTIKLAKSQGVTHLGIVNHDTIKGLKEAMTLGRKHRVQVIPGVEISAYDYKRKKKLHILGYNFDLEGSSITKICEPILEARQQNATRQINLLIQHGYTIDPKEIFKLSQNSLIIYKQHIMAELIRRQYTDSIYSELYYSLFKNGGICSGEISYVEATEAIRAIKADGGLAILAHPGQSQAYESVEELVEAGLDGIELMHECHTEEDYSRIKELQQKHDLILTGGSDFHGDYGSTSIKIGDITAPKEFLRYFV